VAYLNESPFIGYGIDKTHCRAQRQNYVSRTTANSRALLSGVLRVYEKEIQCVLVLITVQCS